MKAPWYVPLRAAWLAEDEEIAAEWYSVIENITDPVHPSPLPACDVVCCSLWSRTRVCCSS